MQMLSIWSGPKFCRVGMGFCLTRTFKTGPTGKHLRQQNECVALKVETYFGKGRKCIRKRRRCLLPEHFLLFPQIFVFFVTDNAIMSLIHILKIMNGS